MALLLAIVRGRCGKESSRSLSHLLMSFLLYDSETFQLTFLYGRTIATQLVPRCSTWLTVDLPELVSNADAAMTSSLFCAATASIDDVTNNEAAIIVIPEISMTTSQWRNDFKTSRYRRLLYKSWGELAESSVFTSRTSSLLQSPDRRQQPQRTLRSRKKITLISLCELCWHCVCVLTTAICNGRSGSGTCHSPAWHRRKYVKLFASRQVPVC